MSQLDVANCNSEQLDAMRAVSALTSLLALGLSASLLVAVSQLSGIAQVVSAAALGFVLWCRWLPQLSHPLVWFTPPYLLYSLSFPILALLGLYTYDATLQKTVFLHSLALWAFAVPLVWWEKPFPRDRVSTQAERHLPAIGVPLFAAGVPVAIVLLLAASALGLSSKRELVDSTSPIVALAVTTLNALFVLGVLLVTKGGLRTRALWFVSILAGLSLLAVGYLGERDYVLRLAVCVVLLSWDLRRRPTMRTAFFLGISLFAVLPLLQAMKAIFLGGSFSYTFAAVDLIGQEFRVMAQNTWLTLSSNATTLLTSGQALVMEIARIVGAGRSVVAWFNEMIVATGEQRGFSMVAAAYLIGGAAGVSVVYLLAGLLFGWLYGARRRSVYWLCAFALAAPMFVYAQRADLANFIAPLLKWVALPLLVIAGLAEFESRRRVAPQVAQPDP